MATDLNRSRTAPVEPRIASRTFGTKKPNLVLIYDTGEGLDEFRVQLEVYLSRVQGKQIRSALESNTMSSLLGAKAIVISEIPDDATPAFKEIVARAFDDNLPQRQGQPG